MHLNIYAKMYTNYLGSFTWNFGEYILKKGQHMLYKQILYIRV